MSKKETPEEKAFREIANTFTKSVTADQVESFGRASYVSWSNVWKVVLQHYPSARFTFQEFDNPHTINGESIMMREEIQRQPSGSAIIDIEVFISVEGVEVSRRWRHPLFDGNRLVRNPDVDKINKGKLRALVKCLSFFGLGLELWTGEDLPDRIEEEPPVKARDSRPKRRTPKAKTVESKASESPARDENSDDNEKLMTIEDFRSSVSHYGIDVDVYQMMRTVAGLPDVFSKSKRASRGRREICDRLANGGLELELLRTFASESVGAEDVEGQYVAAVEIARDKAFDAYSNSPRLSDAANTVIERVGPLNQCVDLSLICQAYDLICQSESM